MGILGVTYAVSTYSVLPRDHQKRHSSRPSYFFRHFLSIPVSTPTDSTIPVQERHRFDAVALEAWFAAHVGGFRGPLTAE